MATKKAATRKTTTTTVEESPDEREELDAFDRARLDFSGELGVKLTIYRYDDGETAYLKRTTYDPDTIDEEWIRKRWGAGSYQLRFTDEAGARHWSKVIHIAADTPPTLTSSPGPSSAETALLDTLRRQNEIMLQAVLTRATAPAAIGTGGGSEALVALIQGMQAQNTELLRASLNRPDVSQTILQVLERGMSIAAENQLDAEGGWMAQAARVAKGLLPAISEMAKIRVDAQAQAIARVGAGGGGMPAGTPPPSLPPGAPVNGEPKAPSASPTSSADGLDLDELIRNFSPSILEAIANGASPQAVADNILAYIPPAYYDVFRELTPERAIRAAPALSQHRSYVEKLVRNMRDSDDDEEEEREP